MKKLSINSFTISMLIIIIGIFAYIRGIPFLEMMELETIDLRFISRGVIEPGNKIVLAVIDEKSLAREGKWIWPRTKIAQLLQKLSQAGAKVVAFDVGFLESDESDLKIIKTIEDIDAEIDRQGIDNAVLKEYTHQLKQKADNDKILAQAIKTSKAKVVLGYFFHMNTSEIKHLSQADKLQHAENIKGTEYKLVNFRSGTDLDKTVGIKANMPQSNVKLISQATNHAGYFNMAPDPDGVVRWIPTIMSFKNNLYVPLSLKAVSVFLDQNLKVNVSEYGIESIRLGSQSIPVDESGRILINYRGHKQTFPHISVTDILHGNFKQNTFKDKIVFVGATATGIYDLRVTPFEGVFPGLEVHANVSDNILQNDFLQMPAWVAGVNLLAIIFLALVIGLVLPRVGPIWSIAAVMVMFTGYIFFCQFLFVQGIVLNLVYPLSTAVFLFICVTVQRYLVESRQKRFIRGAFSTYLAPAVVNRLIDSPESLVLGGEERVITAFFSDVQGFTSISEKLSPHNLVELLNEFLTEMTDIIHQYEGTVDKFEGDAIIAFFGAPTELEKQAEAACLTSIMMQKKLIQMRQKWREHNQPELKMRIGLCTGPATVGNMGSRNRMDYTMMGDTVNTAARLEGVNKVYGTYSMISGSTFQQLDDPMIITRELDSILVVGKKEAVIIYELMGMENDLDDRTREWLAVYSQGLTAYRAMDWTRAATCFQSVIKLSPQDGPAALMLKRCDHLKINPPGKDWNAAFAMENK